MQAQPAIAELRRAVALEAHTHHHVTRTDVAQTDVLSDPLRMTRRQRRVQARVAAWHPKEDDMAREPCVALEPRRVTVVTVPTAVIAGGWPWRREPTSAQWHAALGGSFVIDDVIDDGSVSVCLSHTGEGSRLSLHHQEVTARPRRLALRLGALRREPSSPQPPHRRGGPEEARRRRSRRRRPRRRRPRRRRPRRRPRREGQRAELRWHIRLHRSY